MVLSLEYNSLWHCCNYIKNRGTYMMFTTNKEHLKKKKKNHILTSNIQLCLITFENMLNTLFIL